MLNLNPITFNTSIFSLNLSGAVEYIFCSIHKSFTCDIYLFFSASSPLRWEWNSFPCRSSLLPHWLNDENSFPCSLTESGCTALRQPLINLMNADFLWCDNHKHNSIHFFYLKEHLHETVCSIEFSMSTLPFKVLCVFTPFQSESAALARLKY